MSHRPLAIPVVLALLVAALASVALAADGPVPQAGKAAIVAPGTNSATAPSTPGGPRLPDDPAAAPAPVRAPLTAEEKALADLQAESGRKVATLVQSMQGLQDGPALRALQKKVEEVKAESQLQFLRTKVSFAQARGDLKSAQEGEAIIQRILNPPQVATTQVPRQAPEKPVNR